MTKATLLLVLTLIPEVLVAGEPLPQHRYPTVAAKSWRGLHRLRYAGFQR